MMLRWVVLVLALVLAAASPDVAAQSRSSFSNPAEYDAYQAALAARDPARRATAMEVFVAWYPGSIVRNEALEHAMAAWTAAKEPVKADFIAGKLRSDKRPTLFQLQAGEFYFSSIFKRLDPLFVCHL